MKKRIIYGCEAQGDADVPYLTRWFLLRTRRGNLYLHLFHRGDHERALHDHPWNFWTLILWRGYIEHTPSGSRRLWPLTFHRRRATHRHRVELCGGPAVTLVWVGPRCREWGFIRGGVWQRFMEYFADNGC